MKNKNWIMILICALVIGNPLGFSQEIPQLEILKGPEAEPIEEAPAVEPGHVTVNFKDADIRTVLAYFSEVSGIDIVPAPNVTGTVTLKLTNKPWEIALDVIVRNYGYAIEREQNIIRVVTVESLKRQELSTETVELNYAKGEEIQDAVKDMLSERGKITYDSRTNILLITDVPANLYRIKQVVSKLDRQTPQIMIEARIIETALEKDEKLGIDWNLKIAAAGAKRPTTVPFEFWATDWGLQSALIKKYFPQGQTAASTTTIGTGGATQTTGTADFPSTATEGVSGFPFVDADVFTYGTLDFSQFSMVIELLKQRRDTEIISNPRITTLNNQEAKIVVGRVYNFPTFTQVEETGKWIISGYDPKELGIKLLVTPHVNERNEIVVDVKPEISNYLGLEQISEELSAPLWSTREAETQVMIGDGDTIFIGGLITENSIELDKKIPLLGDLFGDVPFFGQLVKHKAINKEKTELIFFITVYIVKDLKKLRDLVISAETKEAFIPKYVTGEEKKAAAAPKPKEGRRPWFDFRKKKK